VRYPYLGDHLQALDPVVREALFHAPLLRSSKVDLFLDILFTCPALRNKIKSLKVESKETHAEPKGMTYPFLEMPTGIPGIKPQLLRYCVAEVRKLAIDADTKEWWVADLRVKSLLTHGTLLNLLFAMLPCIEELYLGGPLLANFPLCRGMLPELDHPEEYEFGLHYWDPRVELGLSEFVLHR
jgi:hypothetical protein